MKISNMQYAISMFTITQQFSAAARLDNAEARSFIYAVTMLALL